jgi:hypothetical protein
MDAIRKRIEARALNPAAQDDPNAVVLKALAEEKDLTDKLRKQVEGLHSPAEKFRLELEEINRVLEWGNITQEEANLLLGTATKELLAQQQIQERKGTSALERGSSAEFSARMQFNDMFASALNSRCCGVTDFAMKHDDVEPQELWLDALADERDRTGADIVSAVIRIKEETGNTSTAIASLKTGRAHLFTITEVLEKLPATFSAEDAVQAGFDLGGDQILLVNTGLWMCSLLTGWANRFPGFRCLDQIVRDETGHAKAVVYPEDWLLSEWAAANGLKVFATTKVAVAHRSGDKEYRNDHVGGTSAVGPDFTLPSWLLK